MEFKAKHFQYVDQLVKFLNKHMFHTRKNWHIVSADRFGEGMTLIYFSLPNDEI